MSSGKSSGKWIFINYSFAILLNIRSTKAEYPCFSDTFVACLPTALKP
jgi:hypothetical protein